jgi:glyoxylase-like metal-dependent hydrolase (beta-lactamase superfamily II)
MTRVSFGAARVTALRDAEGSFFAPLLSSFEGVTEQVVQAARAIDPAVFDDAGEWRLFFHCYLIEVAGKIVLVDLGIGSADALASAWAPTPGQFPDALHEAGVSDSDVDLVVLTHLHSDHVGWSVTDGAPTYPNARYVLQTADAGWAGEPMQKRVVEPLQQAGCLDLIDGDRDLLPGLRAIATPGHTPGHQSVRLYDDLLIAGDLVVHPIQLADPAQTYAHEEDPEMARASRTRALAEAAESGMTLAVGHFSRPFVSHWR